MANTEEFINMVYWILGIIIVIFIIDWFWLKPRADHTKTELLIDQLRSKHTDLHPKFGKLKIDYGIVMVIDSGCVQNGSLLIASLRHLGCHLPIMVYYLGPDSLTEHELRFLNSLHGVTLKDLYYSVTMVDKELITKDTAKVWALIDAPFKNVCMVNPDLLFLRNPEYLFNDPRYIETGALFWKDKAIQRYWDKKVYSWVNKLIPYRRGDNRILDKKAGNYQSDALLLLNKEKHQTTIEKLWLLNKNSELVYRYLPSSKECYWIAAELAKQDYTFVGAYPGVIGELNVGLSPNTLCGHLLHFDSNGYPLCWDGSVFEASGRTVEFTHYSPFYPDSEWTVALHNNCLKSRLYSEVAVELRYLVNEYLKLIHDIKERLVKEVQPIVI